MPISLALVSWYNFRRARTCASESEDTMSHAGKRDKGKHENKKKPAHTLKEKRKIKHEKKVVHPEEIVAKIHA
jgi:hypothetical protein